MKKIYHYFMYKISTFLYGPFSTKAHKHLGALASIGFIEGLKKGQKSMR